MISSHYIDVDDALDEFAAAAGADVVEFGRSVDDRPLRAAVVAASTPNAPTVLVDANLHGVEFVGAACALGVLRALGNQQGASLRKRANVVVAPLLNPDGHARTRLQNGVGTIKQLRGNAHGVDLNRNFPRPHDAPPAFWAASGSNDPASPTYRGTAPFSEPEARAIDALASQHKFHAAVSFHSFMGTLIPPKVTTASDAAMYRRLCRAWRRGQRTFFYPTFMCAPLDVFTGELEDHLHHVHKCWSLTVEVYPLWRTLWRHARAPSLFERFNPDDPRVYVDDAVAGCLAYLDAALDQPRP